MALKKNYSALNYLKAFAAFFVVFHHCATYCGLMTTNDTIGFACYFIGTATNGLFFLISGYLCHEQKLMPYYSKKLTKILIPFVVFSVMKLVYGIFISDEHAHAASLWEQIYDAFVCGSLYWFIYSILITFMISPLFWKLKKWNILLLVLCFGFYSVVDLFDIKLPNEFQIDQTLFHIGYFIAGYVLQMYGEKISAFAQKHKDLLFFVSLALVTGVLGLRLMTVDNIPYIVKVPLAFAQIYLLFLFAKKLPENNAALTFVGNHSLQVFFFDSFFKVILVAIMRPTTLVQLLLVVLLNISLTCIACAIIKKIPYVKVLVGL